ncbi:MAG TPA: YhjD/YihY/BrkB family envelope integrity protein [Mycobacteriales bacterium]
MRNPSAVAGRLRTAVDRARRRAPPPVLRVVTRTAGGLQHAEPFDRGMTLAAQAFTSIFPLVIAIAALIPDSSASLPDRVSDALGIPDSSRAIVEQALPAHPDTRGAFGLAGVLIVVVSATSFSRALARMYGKVWRVTPPGWTGGWRWVLALFGVAVSAVTLRALGLAVTGLYATVGELVLTLVLNGLLWTWAPWLLLARQVSWRRLLPGGVIMGLCTVGTSVASGIYLPRALVSASRQFGALGIAFTYIGWLFVVAFLLVCSTVLGAVLARDESRLARLVVGAPRDPAGPD